MAANLITIPTLAAATREQLIDYIPKNHGFDADAFADSILAVATSFNASEEDFPTTLEGLLELDVDDYAAQTLMQQVFGSTDIVVGKHTRKFVCALDFFDWEGCGVKSKKEIRMKHVSARSVKASLETWLPRGQRMKFQDTVENLTGAIARSRQGFWGRLQGCINSHFSPKEKPQIKAIVIKILQYYVATKPTRKVTVIPSSYSKTKEHTRDTRETCLR